jgi:hypothetical protein
MKKLGASLQLIKLYSEEQKKIIEQKRMKSLEEMKSKREKEKN